MKHRLNVGTELNKTSFPFPTPSRGQHESERENDRWRGVRVRNVAFHLRRSTRIDRPVATTGETAGIYRSCRSDQGQTRLESVSRSFIGAERAEARSERQSGQRGRWRGGRGMKTSCSVGWPFRNTRDRVMDWPRSEPSRIYTYTYTDNSPTSIGDQVSPNERQRAHSSLLPAASPCPEMIRSPRPCSRKHRNSANPDSSSLGGGFAYLLSPSDPRVEEQFRVNRLQR